MKEFFKDRYNLLALFFILFGAVILVQLVNLQIINGKRYDEESQRKLPNIRRVSAPRGNIEDRYGVPLAVNRVGYTIQIIKTKMNNDDRNEMLLKLVNIFEKNNDNYDKSLEKYLKIKPFAFGSAINGSSKKMESWKKDMDPNKKNVDLMSTPEGTYQFLRKKFDIDKKYSVEDAYKIMCIRYEMLIRGFTSLTALSLAKDVSRETVAELEERHQEFPGIYTDVETFRKYTMGETAGHVIGFVRPMDEEEYEKLKEEGYRQDEIVGKLGIEAFAEPYLRGKDGQKKIEVDIAGRLTEELETNPAIPGSTVKLTLDMNLQKVAMESIERNLEKIRSQADGKKNFGDAKTGSAVAMDVNTGEILAMASYPSYDPSNFIAKPEDKEAQKKIEEYYDVKKFELAKLSPTMNRVINGRYAPGSTFKPLTAIAALETGVITKGYNTRYDPGYFDADGWMFKCLEYKHGHGNLTLKRAMETSCNIYFEQVGCEAGIDNISKWGTMFGLGKRTGIDLKDESKGVLASREYKKSDEFKRNYGRIEDWWKADTAQASIGQIYNLVTPLQLVNYIGAIANGGKLMRPHLIKKVVKYDGSTVMENKPDYTKIPVKKENLDLVIEGMKAVTMQEGGTAVSAFRNFPIEVAGKTGTAETGYEKTKSSNALFVCFAPADKPQIAIAVVVENGAWGANTAPIAVDIMTEYFNLSGSARSDDKLKTNQIEFTR
ncbi:penicillin-binding protein 2 [Pseudobacteroides cellulosolvens]|uniref:Penicillin-binding protein 2 n=1 Tax=Pseudobacteroides cellulosolvens ATCC 35603 = DSM 2933 TaxID=398512 RepID=A0A0L6JNZ4_9FIRM|nr:penicillin-binding protein 2 [Pseudobacteroides cellulosolvens]KNY27087.1 penicillin-binding protein 2 [Pseudobacteroides cellulosolvens ATCC 35603 = DSM 2933]